ncbi:hypothetical protein V9T40_005933 [Parthenolecanium corni]|uniref:BTB domain-containing protein n=1 Tax=Parthenolecanium corni TaxID=536013 RepID=A0AAN9TTR9_9HEMI
MSLRDWTILRHLDSDILKKVRLAFVFGSSGGSAIVITREDYVYAIGKNSSSCLGFDVKSFSALTTAMQNSPLSKMDIKGFVAACTKPDSSSGIEKISVIAVTKDGKIYDWGSKLCRTYSDQQSRPLISPITISDKVKEVSCGTSHVLVLSEVGKVYSYGSNDNRQLGHDNGRYGKNPNAEDCKDSIIQVTGEIEGKFVVEIACGSHFSLALIDDGTLFGWGCNRYGQLGCTNQSSSYSYEQKPIIIPLSSAIKIRRIACGTAHVLALSRNGALYGWGKNDSNQLGLPINGYNSYSTSSPVLAPFKLSFNCLYPYHVIADIGASYLYDLSVAVSERNTVIFWGQSSTGQRFLPTISNYESIDEAFAYLARSMHKPLIIPEKERMTLAESLEKELGNKETSDLMIQTESSEQIHVHKTILKMRSKYFEAKLPQLLKNDDKIVKVKTESFPAMKAYLQYVYTDKLQVNLDLAIELFKLADKFEDNNFKMLCEHSIKRQMKSDKVAELYSATRQLSGAEDLNKFCLEFAVRHANEVMKSPGYKNWDLDTLKTFLSEYVKSREY